MKVGKTLRTLLSFFIAFAMVFPGAVKVNAADHSYPYDVQNNIILDADITGTSTNDHTYAKAFWTNGSTVYLMVESTHDAQAIVLANGGNTYRSTTYTAYPPGDTVTVDKTYYPNETQGNTKDAHLSVFEFPLSEILKLGVTGGSYAITYESEQGLGHWIYGTLKIYIPRAKVEVTKTWKDGPMDDVSIQLYRKLKDADDSTYTPVGNAFTLTTTNPSKTISDLDFTDNIGRIYTYSAKEVNLGEGYASEVKVTGPTLVNGVQVFTVEIKNTYTPPKTDIKVTKVWKDDNDTSGRPSTLTYYLYADDGTEPVGSHTVNSPNWDYTFEDFPKTQTDGTLIKYSVKEAPVPGYETSIDGLTVTNTRSALTDVDVTKLWKDGDDPSGRPSIVTFNLFANGEKIDTVELTSAKSWKHTFEDLDKYDENGKLIKYTVTEDAVTGYTPTIDGLTITNLRVDKVDIPVEKLWKDDGPDGRPGSVTINLLANGDEVAEKSITAAMDWKYTFSQMEKYDENGKLITYTIKEDAVEGYKSEVNGYDVTNTKTGTTDIDVTKIWLDDNDVDARPEAITIYLHANGNQVDSAQLSAEGSWKYTFEDKPAFDINGKTITYTITEGVVPGYVGTVDGFEVTNVRTDTTTVSVDKIWKDEGSELRPDFITVNLLANGMKVDSMKITAVTDWEFTFKDLDKYDDKGKLIVYTITEEPVPEYNTSIDGYTITNTRTGVTDIPVEKFWKDEGPEGRPEFITVNLLANGVKVDEAKLTSLMEWKYTFMEVPEFDEDGKKITYTITENSISGYNSKVSGFTITNTITGDKDIPVEKKWLDGDDPSARPSSITVSLLANGTVVDTALLTKDTGWTYLFEDKPIYDTEGKSISYTIKEKAVDDYTSTVDGFTITNLRTGEIDIPVEKIWLDDGTRTIDKITVNLYKQVMSQPPMDRNEEIVTPSAVALVLVETLELSAANEWKDTFMNLPEFDEKGYLIDYFLEEIPVEGYRATIVENEDGSFTITNLRTGITSVSGTKSWWDEEGTSLRPESITVELLQNGEFFKSMEVTEEEGLWAYSFKELPEFDDKGIAYVYTIEEVSVEGYETSYDGYDIFNLRSGEIDIPVEKIWLDNGERDVEEITINLYRHYTSPPLTDMNSELLTPSAVYRELVDSLVLDEDNMWKDTFEDLPEFDEMGYPIEYTVEEETVEGYMGSMTMNEDGSYTFTNLRTGIIDIEGVKTWYDADEADRPEFITVILMRNGEELDRMDVSEMEGTWIYSFTDLPEFDEEGIAYLYEIDELPVEGYNTIIVGYDIQNTRTGITNVNGEKTWDDLLNRPEAITVNLLQNGVEFDDMVVEENEEGRWLYSFTALPAFDEDGIPYTYTVEEDPLAGYESTVEGYNIMNRQLRGTLRIVKTDDFDEPIEGVIFEIEDAEGLLIDTVSTDEDGIAEVVLPLGTYTITEIFAPEDYIMDDEEKIVIIDEDGETVELTVVNILEIEEVEPLPLPKPTLPKTGAQGSFLWYGMGAILALAGFTLLRKKNTSI